MAIEPFSLEFQVRDYELDHYGVVNNAVYAQYLEHARHELLQGLAIDSAALAASGRSIALSSLFLRFRSSLRSRERFRVTILITELRGVRMVVQQKILRLPGDELVVEAEAGAAFLDERGRPLRLDPAHREKLLRYHPTPA